MVSSPGEIYEARVVDIDDRGRLIVERAGGEREALSSGEITEAPTRRDGVRRDSLSLDP
jgi:biotin-(acetyl-CoA carboxylase) ligase